MDIRCFTILFFRWHECRVSGNRVIIEDKYEDDILTTFMPQEQDLCEQLASSGVVVAGARWAGRIACKRRETEATVATMDVVGVQGTLKRKSEVGSTYGADCNDVPMGGVLPPAQS